MAVKNSGYFPPAGQQNPSRYPRVGPNYMKYGEQPGWTYSPRDDKYYRDQKSREELEKYEIDQGLRSPPPKEPKQPGLGEVILPVAATAGTVALANEYGRKIPDLFKDTPKVDPKLDQTLNTTGQTAPAPSNVTGNVNAPGAGGTPQGLLSANQAPSTGGSAPPANTGAPSAPKLVSVEPVEAVGSATMADGTPGTLMEDGSIIADTGKIQQPNGQIVEAEQSNLGGYIQAAGGVAQGYNGWRQWQEGQKIAGAGNIIAGGANIYGGMTGGATGAAAGKAAGVIAAGANIGQQMANEEGNTADRAAAAKTEALKAALLYIPVYGQAAYAALAGVDALTGGKATKTWASANKSLDRFNTKIDFGLQRAVDRKLFHQSTKGVQKMHTGQLLQQSDDPTWQNYVAGMRGQVNEGPKDPTKPFAGGKYATFEEYKNAGLLADDLTGVYGNLDAFKPDYAEKAGVPDWSKLTYEQQRYMTQKLIDADAYASKKGEVVIPDKEKARRIYEQEAKTNFGAPPAQPGKPIMGGAAQPPAQPQTQPGPAPLQPGQTPQSTAAAASGGLLAAMPPRSNTSSPGIDKNGRRIRY